jgi:hypothetical protein
MHVPCIYKDMNTKTCGLALIRAHWSRVPRESTSLCVHVFVYAWYMHAPFISLHLKINRMVHDISTAFETTETPVCGSYTPPTRDPHGSPIALRSARNAAPLGQGNQPAMRRSFAAPPCVARDLVLAPDCSDLHVSRSPRLSCAVHQSLLCPQIFGMAFGDPHPHGFKQN